MFVIRSVRVGLALLAVAGAAFAQGTEVIPNNQWGAFFTDNKLEKEAPKGGIVTDAKAFAKLWKAWRKDEKLPKVDFTKEFVFVAVTTGPNKVSIHEPTLNKGDLKIAVRATLVYGDGFGYVMATFNRKGVKTVNGKALPKVKPKPGEPGE
jgi:hypothetical protein